MYFYRHLYVGSSIRDPEKIKERLRTEAGCPTIYVIALCQGPGGPGANQLELYHCANLQQPYYRKNPPFIIGIASGRIEAIEVVQQIVQEAYDHTGSGDVRAYLFPHGIVTAKSRRSGDAKREPQTKA